MRLALILAVLGLANPAEAHCFSRWFYKTPQHCGVRLAETTRQPHPTAARVAREASPAPPDDRSWFVEIVLPDPDPGRTQGVERLKTLLGDPVISAMRPE